MPSASLHSVSWLWKEYFRTQSHFNHTQRMLWNTTQPGIFIPMVARNIGSFSGSSSFLECKCLPPSLNSGQPKDYASPEATDSAVITNQFYIYLYPILLPHSLTDVAPANIPPGNLLHTSLKVYFQEVLSMTESF